MPFGITMDKVFIVAIIIAFMDSMDEVIFGSNGFLADFSLISTIIAVAYIIGSLLLWVALLLESLVFLDFITPLTALIEIMMMFIGIVGGSIIDFLFNIIKFPFKFIGDFAISMGLDTQYWFGADAIVAGGAIGLDLPTMSFFLGFQINVGIEIQIGFGLSILGNIGELGGGNNLYLGLDFAESAALGMALRLKVVAIAAFDENFIISIQGLIQEIFNMIKFRSDPQAVFDELLQKIQDLGRELGI